MSFSPPPEKKYIRVAGHAYPRHSRVNGTGGAFHRDGREAAGDYGFGQCECGVFSEKAFLAKADRLRWHFGHRMEMAQKVREEFEKEESDGEQPDIA